MNKNIKTGIILVGLLLVATAVYSQTDDKESTKSQGPICGSTESPYSDFDFVLGSWDFYAMDGTKIGEQTYTRREQGCLILEEWTLSSGSTGTGMSFVDPKTGLWRQVWMSPMFHIDYSGSLNESGAMILEGTIYPNNGDKSSPIRGIWTKQPNGTVKQDFVVFSDKTNAWEILFAGYTSLKTN